MEVIGSMRETGTVLLLVACVSVSGLVLRIIPKASFLQ